MGVEKGLSLRYLYGDHRYHREKPRGERPKREDEDMVPVTVKAVSLRHVRLSNAHR